MLKIYRCSKSFPFSRALTRFSFPDTIFALSSGLGKCGVAVIRVSGPQSENALKQVTRLSRTPAPRLALLRSIRDSRNNEVLDKGLILWFPGPQSFTGEDCFELHVHGGLAVINAVLNTLGSIPKLRMAEPGEFTRRAFFNGKLDLTEVEGLADLLQAETEKQRKQAFLQTQGSLSKLYNCWKKVLTENVAHVEAHIDFEETEILEEGLIETVVKNVKALTAEMERHLADGRKGEILRTGVKTVILGEPNVGKSSLLNLLCRRPAAIVTPIEGTTRDVLEVTLNIAGYPLILADTAGLRSKTEDVIEREGINRALELYEQSNLVLLVIDSEKYSMWQKLNPHKCFNDYLREYLYKLKLTSLLVDSIEGSDRLFSKECLVILNKTDLQVAKELSMLDDSLIKISCRSEDGVTDLIKGIAEKLKDMCADPSEEHPSMNQLRHRQHLTDCLKSLNLFLKTVATEDGDLVIMAECLRRSLRHLGKLVGNVTTEQLLDVIFKDFCIGK